MGNIHTLQKGNRVRLTIKDPKVRHTPGTVINVESSRVQVVLELWSRWGTFSEYFPLWFTADQLEQIPGPTPVSE